MTHLPKRFVLFDTEYTTWPGTWERKWSGPGEHKELVQLAAILVDETLNEVARLDMLCKPVIHPRLSDYFIALTAITQEEVDTHGRPFDDVLKAFHDFTEKGTLPSFSYGNDKNVLEENAHLKDVTLPLFTGGLYDSRPLFEACGIDTTSYTSGTVHKAVNADMQGQVHNALFDARSMLKALQVLRTQGKI